MAAIGFTPGCWVVLPRTFYCGKVSRYDLVSKIFGLDRLQTGCLWRQEGEDLALVFEDDAVLSPDFEARWRRLRGQLYSDDGWDIAFLG